MRMLSPNSSLMLGWQQLCHGRTRMLVALAGNSVAVLLILIVLTLRSSITQSTLRIASNLKGDLIILSPKTQSVMRTAAFPRRLLYRLPAIQGIESVSAVYVDNGRWTNPWTHQEHPIRIYGMELDKDILGLPGISPDDPVLRLSDTVLFDQQARPKFGPVTDEIRKGHSVSAEVNGRRITVAGLTLAGISAAVDGNLFTTHANFQRLCPLQNPAACHMGVARVKKGADLDAVKNTARAMLGKETLILDKPEMISMEEDYMHVNEPIDYIFGMIAAVALFVGGIIVYLILYTDVLNHLSHYATLKAIGFADGFLLRIVFSEGLILSFLGFWPGLALAWALSKIAAKVVLIPIEITPARSALVLLLTTIMCLLAAGGAVRKLASADPADVF